jgi:hypothetical protein
MRHKPALVGDKLRIRNLGNANLPMQAKGACKVVVTTLYILCTYRCNHSPALGRDKDAIAPVDIQTH